MQIYVGKQNWEKLFAIDFHILVTQCERKYTAFASKLLQIPKKSIILTKCNFNRKQFIIDYGSLISITKYAFKCCLR